MDGMTIQEAIRKGIIEPGKSSVHINGPLTNISLAYMQDQMGFVADRVFQRVPVAKQSDIYFTYDRGEFNRDEMQQRADGTESAGATYTIGNETYNAKVWALHRDIGAQTRANADTPIQLDSEATMFLTHKGMIRRERNWAGQYLNSAAWTFSVDGAGTRALTDLTGNATNDALYWSDAMSDPVGDMEFACDTIQESTGFRPNKLVLGKRVYSALKNHTDIIDRMKAGQTPGGPAVSTRQALAAIFDLDEVMVATAIYNTAAAGATASHSFIAGKHALLAYVPPSPGLMTPAAGYTFEWTGLTGMTEGIAGGGAGVAVEKWYSRDRKSDRVEINMAFDQKKVSADLGCFFNGIVQ